MNTPNVDAGRLERRVRRVGRETMPGGLGFGFLLTPLLVGQQKDVARPTRLLGRETMPGFSAFALCLCNSFGAMHGKPLIAPYGPSSQAGETVKKLFVAKQYLHISSLFQFK